MDDGDGNGGGSFKVKDRSDAAEVTNINTRNFNDAGAVKVGDAVGEREMRIESNTKIANRGGASQVELVEEELLDRCIEGYGIYLIWAGTFDEFRFGKGGAEEEPCSDICILNIISISILFPIEPL